MKRMVLTLVLFGGIVAPIVGGGTPAFKARVYNDTKKELKIRIIHATLPQFAWNIGVLDEGKRSDIRELAEGTRIMIVVDPITDATELVHSFKHNAGTRIRLSEVGGMITVQRTVLTVSEDP